MCYDIQKLYAMHSPLNMLDMCEKLPANLTLKQLSEILGFESVEQLNTVLFTASSGQQLLKNCGD